MIMDKEEGTFESEHLSIKYKAGKSDEKNKLLLVSFEGKMDHKYPSLDVKPYLMDIKEKYDKENYKNMEINFTQLDYMNSASIRIILMWIYEYTNKHKNISNENSIVIKYSKDKPWQKSITPTFQDFEPNMIKVQPV